MLPPRDCSCCRAATISGAVRIHSCGILDIVSRVLAYALSCHSCGGEGGGVGGRNSIEGVEYEILVVSMVVCEVIVWLTWKVVAGRFLSVVWSLKSGLRFGVWWCEVVVRYKVTSTENL